MTCGGKHAEAPRILGMKVDATSYDHATNVVAEWAAAGASKYVCVANVNSVMEAYDCPKYQRVMNDADLVTPDGMPLVWGSKLLGNQRASRVYGPDLTPRLLKMAERYHMRVGFFGGAPKALNKLLQRVHSHFPGLEVAYSFSPPFRPITPEEDAEIVDAINGSGTRILFVGLGGSKQDYWMSAHRDRIQTVMLGVGAAFDFLAGTKPQAPRWMMRVGFEWLFRLATEPRRLWKRYLKHNPRFVALFALQLLGLKRFDTAL